MSPHLFPSDSTARCIMDAFPSPLFVIDDNFHILDMNKAAGDYVGRERVVSPQRLCGDVLHCAHAIDHEEECGSTHHCPDCIIRQSVTEATRGTSVVRRWANMELVLNDRRKRVFLLVSASPFTLEGKVRFLLTLEDVSEIAELRMLLPVCSRCGKVRSDANYWQSLQDYLRKHTTVQFSHGLCPECLPALYGEVGKQIAEKLRPGPEGRSETP